MSGRSGGGGVASNGKGSTGISSIPAGSRKMVQGLKEIVNNCTEQEIYAMLKDCNMDPNEAVNRLLAQDPFHEVKSKREKKKENKEPTDSRSRGASNTSNHGGRGGDRYAARGGSNHFSSNESGFSHGKSAHKKENGTHAYGGSAFSMAGHNMSRRPTSYSDSVGIDNKISTLSTDNGISSSSQPSSGYQSAWVGVPGQVSMADVVKMGRPQAKPSTSPKPSNHSFNHHDVVAPPEAAMHHNFHSAQDYVSKVPTEHDEWPLIDPPSVSMSSVLGAPANSEMYADSSNLPLDRTNEHSRSQQDEVQVEEDGFVEAFPSHNGPTSISSSHLQEDNLGGASAFDNSLYEDINSSQTQRHAFEHNEAEDDASTVAADLQQLNLQKDDREAPPEEDNPPVVIPNHLQLHTPDCLNLSFGSFRSGTDSASSGSFASRPLKINLEETSGAVDVSTIGHSEARDPKYYGEEHLMNASDGNLVCRTVASAGDYDSPSVSKPEVLKQETPEVGQGNQYVLPSAPGFAYENSQQLNVAFSHPQQTSLQMPNNAHFASVMAYTNSLPSALLASSAQAVREDFPYSPFPMTQSMPTKYSNAASSISGPTISMTEALRAGGTSAAQPTLQTLAGASVATGPALPQQLGVHPYSQPTLPLGHFSNMIGYPFLPQSYAYMPSAFQQTFAGNSTYHQSLAAVLPQYKNNVSASSLPQSANVPPGYGFDSSTSIPGGNFPLNPSSAPTGTTIGYDDAINSQYKDNSHLISLQQNDNSGMWVHGPGSRAMSAVPASNYYSFQGQNQQHAGFRQAQQQPSQQFAGALGYPNYYHSQTGMSLEHQQRSSRDASLGGSQGQQPSKQSQQLWQNSY